MTLIRQLIDIPTHVRDGDFVFKLTEGVGKDAAAATVESYEVTPQPAHAFDEALGKTAGAVSSGSSETLYLQGSFGAGKSHFMPVLHLLLPCSPDRAALSGTILAVLVPLAATGFLGLAAVVAIHELAEVVVIANGVRAGSREAFESSAGGPPGDTTPLVSPAVMPVPASGSACTDGCYAGAAVEGDSASCPLTRLPS